MPIGEAKLSVTLKGGIQSSNFGNNSFQVINSGEKTITRIEIDVTNALFPDAVFDPYGLAGDTAFKKLTIDSQTATGFVPSPDADTYIGNGGAAGYEAIRLNFDPGVDSGFEPGESIGFSIDMDPNSIAGSSKAPLDGAAIPAWDVGGVNGAELIGSAFTVTFADGTIATGQLQGVKSTATTNSQGGSQALATQDAPAGDVVLTVDGLGAGETGSREGVPEVVVNGPAGETARIVLVKGFVQPGSNPFEGSYASRFENQIADLYASEFPANNAVEFQVVDIVLTGAPQVITSSFDYSDVPPEGVPNPDRLPLGFVGGLIDPQNGDLPVGAITQPIYLRAPNVAPSAGDDQAEAVVGTSATLSVLSNDQDADGDVLRLWSVTQGSNGSVAANSDGTVSYTPAAGFSGTDSFAYTVSDGQGGQDTATVTVEVLAAPEEVETVLGINVGGNGYVDVDGVVYGADQYASGGQTYRTSATIVNTDDDVLYQTERFGTFDYALPVGNGTYDVTLRFAEPVFNTAGKRVFDVAAEGTVVIDDLDIWSAAGGRNVAHDVTVRVEVTDGTLDLDFLAGVENPKLNALLVQSVSSGGGTPGGNTAPVAANDQATLGAGTTATLAVLANDTDADGDALSIASVTQGSNGSVAANSDGTVSYTPAAGFSGTDSFAYTVSDGQGGQDTATVTVEVLAAPEEVETVLGINVGGNGYVDVDGVVYGADQYASGGQTYRTSATIVNTDDDVLYQTERFGTFDYALPVGNGTYDVTLRFAEPVFNTAGKRVFDVAAEGTVVIDDLDIWSAAGGRNVAHDVTVRVEVTDGTLDLDFLAGVENPKLNAILVQSVSSGGGTPGGNTAPVAANDQATLGAGTTATLAVLANDTDADGDALSIASVTQGSNGSVAANSDGTVSYTPAAGFSGTDSFAYTVSDGQGGQDTATVTVEVLAAPEEVETVLGINVGGNGYVDVDGVVYGADQYASGGQTYRTSATIVNTDDDVLYQTERFGTFDYALPVGNGTYDVTLRFAEPVFNTAGKRVFDVAAEGTVVIDDLDIWSAAGGRNVAHDVTVRVEVTDGTLDLDFLAGVENPKLNAILVQSVSSGGGTPGGNTAPVAANDQATLGAGTTATLAVLANDTDADGDALSIASVTQGSNGSVAANSDGTVSYTPAAGFSGTDSFAYTVSDGQGGQDTATVTVEVLAADQIAFSTFALSGIPDRSYTSLEFGPDGRLYASHRFGELYAFEIEERLDSTGAITGYAATDVERIDLINTIPNHDDDGTLNPGVTARQVTGIVVAGTAEAPVLYVSSSDPREGGGSGGGSGDTGLDTNSGVISRLTLTDGGWEKVDLVRGLPRSEENHSTNGMELTRDPDTGDRVLLVAQGGHTNAGAPSTNFAHSSEYALSAAILEVNLDRLESGVGDFAVKTDGAQRYVYDLPTVLGSVFGGQDGLNQARLVADGPVSVYSSGWRNPYDVVVTENGDIFTIDNGANKGWGGLPAGEGTENVTNRIPTTDPDGFNSVNNLDHLEQIAGRGYYGGHPNPIRANPENAGLLHTDASGAEVWTQMPAGTWPPVDPSLSFPDDGDFLLPGVEDNALVTWKVSTNGLDEYTASNFGGSMKGDLITAAFDSSIYRISLDPSNTGATREAIASGLNGIPLDVTAQGDFDPFPGTIWIGYVAGSADIEVLVPTRIKGTALDLDGDGYSNQDELANGTNPNSPSSVPPDNDTDLVSDLGDEDDDNDGVADPRDHFAIDAANGTGLVITADGGFFNPLRNDDPGVGFSGLGFTGWMNNGSTNYLDQYDPDNLIAGGTSGIFSIVQTTAGDARGSANSQENGFQFGVANDLSGSAEGTFLVNARMLSVFSPLEVSELADGQSAGIQIGTGDQDNYIKLAVAAHAGGLDIAVLHEEDGAVISETFSPASIPIGAQVDLFFEIDPSGKTVTPGWQVDGGALETGPTLTLSADSNILSAIRGTYENNGVPSAMAVGVISTHGETGTPFSAQYDHINVYPGSLSGQATTDVLLTSSATNATSFDASDTFLFSDDVDYLEINDFDLSGFMPEGIVMQDALPPGIEKQGDFLPPGLAMADAGFGASGIPDFADLVPFA